MQKSSYSENYYQKKLSLFLFFIIFNILCINQIFARPLSLETRLNKSNIMRNNKITSSGFTDYFSFSLGGKIDMITTSGNGEILDFTALGAPGINVGSAFFNIDIANVAHCGLIAGYYKYFNKNSTNNSYSFFYGLKGGFDLAISGNVDVIIFTRPDSKELSKEFKDMIQIQKNSHLPFMNDNSDFKTGHFAIGIISIGAKFDVFKFSIPFIDALSLKIFCSGRYFKNSYTAILAETWENLVKVSKYAKDPKVLWEKINNKNSALIVSLGVEGKFSIDSPDFEIATKIFGGYKIIDCMTTTLIHTEMDEPMMSDRQKSYIGLKIAPKFSISDSMEIKIGYTGYKIFATNDSGSGTTFFTQTQHKGSLGLEVIF